MFALEGFLTSFLLSEESLHTYLETFHQGTDLQVSIMLYFMKIFKINSFISKVKGLILVRSMKYWPDFSNVNCADVNDQI